MPSRRNIPLALDVTGNGAITVDLSTGRYIRVNLTANTDITFTNPVPGELYIVELTQSGGGGFTCGLIGVGDALTIENPVSAGASITALYVACGASGGLNVVGRCAQIQAAIADPAGGGTVDAEARAAINAIIDALNAAGIVST